MAGDYSLNEIPRVLSDDDERLTLRGLDGSGTETRSLCRQGMKKSPFNLVLDSSTGRQPCLPGQLLSARRKKGFYTLQTLSIKKTDVPRHSNASWLHCRCDILP
ncbi:hypothetical protein K504DRAFT_537056 [Pleomassaria siparia CBS 279.74]|uniref:Uncharacterized protein n=1 Tax=Pleomassaria siparia CBS 279.74 TaxID=1314801 RepID=A0A6G1JYX5_9PLEO|nr:hypothetical protein K504DRAFT_537056 [Pleomassaria siparia CBS 279.74]